MRYLTPDSMAGALSFEDVLNHSINFGALDRRGAPTRIRLNSTVIRVEHSGSRVSVVYANGGRLYRARAEAVVMASAS